MYLISRSLLFQPFEQNAYQLFARPTLSVSARSRYRLFYEEMTRIVYEDCIGNNLDDDRKRKALPSQAKTER